MRQSRAAVTVVGLDRGPSSWSASLSAASREEAERAQDEAVSAHNRPTVQPTAMTRV